MVVGCKLAKVIDDTGPHGNQDIIIVRRRSEQLLRLCLLGRNAVFHLPGRSIVSLDDKIRHLDIFPICMKNFLIYYITVRLDACLPEKPAESFSKNRPGMHISYNRCLTAGKTRLENIRSHG